MPFIALRPVRDMINPLIADRETEREFRLSYYEDQRTSIRNWGIVATLAVLSLAPYDFHAYGTDFWKSFVPRLFLCGSSIFLACITYYRSYPAVARWLNGVLAIVFSISALGSIVFLYLAPISVMSMAQACANMILVIVFTTVGVGITPLYVLTNCVLVVPTYFILGILIFHEQMLALGGYTVNLTIGGVFSVIFAIQRERVVRENFLLNRSLDAEKREAERFLFELVPPDAIAKIKRGEAVADIYEDASTVFCDLAGFTSMSETQRPARLIVILNELFNLLDDIAAEIGVEKVKTIGDNFMGIVKQSSRQTNPSSASIAIAFGLKAVELVERYGRNQGLEIRMRVGINTGDVIGGVVGKTKFYYDYWGDSVNVASRMQSTGELGRVQVTEATQKAAMNEFCFEPRGQIEIRGKGRMRTFFVTGHKQSGLPLVERAA